MAEVGRNDPCPCGSGKKYKHCHWRIDQQLQRQNLQLERAWQTVNKRIQEFSFQDSFLVDYVSAWERFWDDRVPLEAVTQLGPQQLGRFMEWYLYDYRTDRGRKGRPHIAELFLEARQDELSDLEQDLVRDWVKTHFSVYEEASANPEEPALRDVFTDEVRPLDEASAGALPPGRTLALARLLPLGGALRIAPSFALIPAEDKAELQSFVEPRFKAWQEARYGADWDDFLSEAGYLLNHFVIRNMEPIDAPEPQSEVDPEQAVRAIARRMQSEIITTNLNLHYERWLDKQVPEWGDRTPREMTESPEDREYVEALLDLLDEIEEDRAETGQPSLDVNLLRSKLGLTTDVRTPGGIILPR
jgi:hypothetical protein